MSLVYITLCLCQHNDVSLSLSMTECLIDDNNFLLSKRQSQKSDFVNLNLFQVQISFQNRNNRFRNKFGMTVLRQPLVIRIPLYLKKNR